MQLIVDSNCSALIQHDNDPSGKHDEHPRAFVHCRHSPVLVVETLDVDRND